VVAALALLVTALPAAAHETTRSYLAIVRSGAEVSARLSIAIRDIEPLIWVDADLDGSVTWREVEARTPDLLARATAGIMLSAGGTCELEARIEGTARLAGVDFADLALAGRCPSADAPMNVSATLLSEIDPAHRIFVSLLESGATETIVLPADGAARSLSVASSERMPLVLAYAITGAEHIAGGWDHILFVLVLLLPALATPASLHSLAGRVLAPVTGFTLGHAAALTAATLGVALPQPDIVAQAILLTILLTAVDNLWPFLPGPRAIIAAVFGLIHGFGFAAALGGLPLDGPTLALALLGFNLGVEAAQIAAVAVVLPALAVLRAPRALQAAGSIGAILVTAVLLVPGTALNLTSWKIAQSSWQVEARF
jgi:hypothetical protein